MRNYNVKKYFFYLSFLVLSVCLFNDNTYSEEFTSPVLYSGWNIISLPFVPSATSPSECLGLEDPMIYSYSGNDLSYSTESVSMEIGKGYAMKLDYGSVITASGTAVSTGTFYEIGLTPGWNLIGNPFNKDIDWNGVSIDGVSLFSSDKVQPEIFEYEPSSQLYPYNVT